MFDYSHLKSIALRVGISPAKLLALAPTNDPFYVGAPGQLEKGKWFAEVYAAMGSPTNCHIRRVHYWLVTTKSLPKPNGRPYENTDNDWGLLTLASKYARYLGLVPIENIVDRRNPDPEINAYTWKHTTPGAIRDSIDESNIINSIVSQFTCYNPCETQAYLLEVWCFTPDTEVQTISGPKPISQIQVGEMVLTHKGRYRRVINAMKREYSGDLVSICSRYSTRTVRATPDHKVLSAWGGSKKYLDGRIESPEWVEIGSLSDKKVNTHYKGNYVAFPRLSEWYDIPQKIKTDNTTRNGRSNGSGARSAQINEVEIDSDVAWMLGYFVGNGFASAKGLVFTLNTSNIEYSDRLVEIGRRFGIEPRRAIYGNTTRVNYNSVRLCKWFKEQFGGESLGRSHTGAWNKRIPQWIIQGPYEIAVAFINGLWDADGAVHSRGHRTITTCSRNIAAGLRILLSRFGEFPRMHKTKDNHFVVGWGGSFNYGRLSDSYLWCPLKSIERSHYEGFVYNIEVEEDNSYVTEFVVHNCEKSTMNDILVPLCQKYGMNLVTGLGELSITAIYQLAGRITAANKPVRIIYVSDFDPAGEGMPISAARKIEYFVRTYNLSQDIKLIPLLLTPEQCEQYSLPRVPIKNPRNDHKSYLARKRKFESRHGSGATELDAMEALYPGEMAKIIEQAIEPYFNPLAWNEAIRKNREVQERVRKYLLGFDCEYCYGARVIEDWDVELERAVYTDCTHCNGTGSIPGRIGEGVMSDLFTSDLDTYSPAKGEIVPDSNTPGIYHSKNDYITQIEVYRAHRNQRSDDVESNLFGDDTNDDSPFEE